MKIRALLALVVSVLAVVLVAAQLPASAAGTAQPSIVSAVPGATPNILDGTAADGTAYRVFDIAQVGSEIVVVGTFAQVTNPGSNTAIPRANVFAFDPATGQVDPNFAPNPSGPVNAVAAGPTPGTVYIAGQFGGVNGATTGTRNLALLNLADGSKVSGFATPAMNGSINDIGLLGNRLFVGGVFTSFGGATHHGIASINATTGAVDTYTQISLDGHHNYPFNGTASAPVGDSKLDISPDGTTMMLIGNFKTANSLTRDQVAMVTLGSTSATVNSNWQTTRYSPACSANAFDSYIRDVQFSPDGTYFVIAATGGPHPGTLCDAAARFNTADTGQTVQPYWVDVTGGDTLWSVAVTGTAVYLGGHNRWMNNPSGSDKAAPGAVPRPGLGAVDPLSGVPLTWNPGRNPRGIGAQALLATSDALYVGSDTNYIGNFQYKKMKIARFPLAGGTQPPSQFTGSLPGNVYLAGNGTTDNTVRTRTYDGNTTVSGDSSVANGGIAWSKARGAFMAGNTLYYGFQDVSGTFMLARQSFDGTTFGPQQVLSTPYHDPAWMNVQTGSGQTYDGMYPNFYGTELGNVTGMFYSNGRLYYAKSGVSTLLYRNFSVDSGIVSNDVFTAASSGFGNAGGMFLNGNALYVADRTNGNLNKLTFTNGVVSGTPQLMSGPKTDGKDWRTRALFLGPTPGAPPPNQPPTASFTASCSGLTCNFDASASSDPNGDPLTYAWDFGDGTTGTGKTTSRTYAAAGSDVVTLTVNDGRGGTNSIQQTVNPTTPPTSSVGVRGVSGTKSAAFVTSISVPVPVGVQPGDGLVLVVSNNTATPGTATGFTQPTGGLVANSTAMTTQVLQRVADGTEGTSVAVSFGGTSVKGTVQLIAYSGTPSGGPVRTVTTHVDSGTATHTSPTATAVGGDWVLSVWSDRNTGARSWIAPGGVVVRDEEDAGTSSAEISTLAADSGASVAAGTVGGLTAQTTLSSTRATEMTIVIAGS